MATTSRGKRGRILIFKSLRLLENHKRLFIFPIAGYICKFIIYALLITPFIHSRESLMRVNTLSSAQIVLVIVIFMLLLFVINLILFFYNTAIIANILYFLKDKQEASIKFGLSQAVKNYVRVFMWALYAGTVGVAFNVLPKGSQYRLKWQKLLHKNHWHIASFFSLSLVMEEKLTPFAAMRESAALTVTLWGSNLKANYSFSGLLFWLRTPFLGAFIYSVIFARTHTTIMIVGLIAGLAILLTSSFYQMISTCLRVVCYCYVKHGVIVEPFTQDVIERLFVPRV